MAGWAAGWLAWLAKWLETPPLYTAPLYTTRENLRPILDELNSPNFPTISFRISRERNKPFSRGKDFKFFRNSSTCFFFFLFIMNITYTYYAIRGINELRKKLSKKKRKRKEDTIISWEPLTRSQFRNGFVARMRWSSLYIDEEY